MSQVGNRNSSAVKRARTDGGRREDDWTCPSCGNVNFSFRMTCNMHNCNQSRPVSHTKSAPKILQAHSPYASPAGYLGPLTPSSMYLNVPPYSSPFGGSNLPPYDMRYSRGSTYHYDYGTRLSYGGPYGPVHLSGPPYSGGSMMETGGMYGLPPPLMDRFSLNMGHSAYGTRSPGAYHKESSQKKSVDAGRENDWICPKCNNNNFSFRTVCNMRKCGTPRPGSQGGAMSESMKGSKSKMPEGSWTCKCGNINFPFRTKCNRQNCGAERPPENKDNGSAPTPDASDQ